MNGYECNGTDIFMRWKIKCSIQRGDRTNEKHSLFVLYNIKK